MLAIATFVTVQRYPAWIERLPLGRLRHATTALLGRVAPASICIDRDGVAIEDTLALVRTL